MFLFLSSKLDPIGFDWIGWDGIKNRLLAYVFLTYVHVTILDPPGTLFLVTMIHDLLFSCSSLSFLCPFTIKDRRVFSSSLFFSFSC